MPPALQAPLCFLGRLALCVIFIVSAVGNKIPNFSGTVDYMKQNGVPSPEILLVGAIVFLIVGSISVVLGFRARIGALMLLVFLGLATYYFHDFWTIDAQNDAQAYQNQMIQFMKNLSMAGAMIFIIGIGSGPASLDGKLSGKKGGGGGE